MSEDKKKSSAAEPEAKSPSSSSAENRNNSRIVTSDSQNSASAKAGKTRVNTALNKAEADSFADDEILDIIRKRKAETSDTEPASDSDAGGVSAAPEEDIAAQEDAAPEEDIAAQEDAAPIEDIDSEVKAEGSEDAPAADSDGNADPETDDAVSVSDADAADDAESEEPKEDTISELEKEIFGDLDGETSEDDEDKRYGFKPYTRELQAEEKKHLREVSKDAEIAAGAVTGKKMAKGTGNKTKEKTGSSTAKSKSAGSDKKSKTKTSGAAASGGSKSKNSSKKSSSAAKPAPKKKKKWIGFVRAFVRTVIVLVLIAGLAGAGYAAYVVSHAPVIHPKRIYDTLDVSTHIYDDKEKLVDEIYFSENRQIVTYEQLPENLKNAFIAVEDKTFWTHSGFNFKRIIGAILERFHGGRISGTSTITQQLARNVFLPEDKSVRSIKRKIIEMYYAYEIEQELSKEEILTAYLNTIYLGYGCYGVDTAAKTYFSRSVEKLSLAQCAALAALPQAPGTYSLLVNEPTETTEEYKHGIYINDASRDRRNMILNMMYQQGMINEKQKKKATKPLSDFIKPGSTDSATSQSAFKDYLIETVKKDLMNEYGIEEDQAIKIIYTKGLNIYTTMDRQAQKAITKQFRDKSNFPSTTNGKGKVESAMVVSEIGTGEIKAMVGTRNVTGQMLFNRATNPRQPGSSIKPLSVYAPALQRSLEYQKEGKTFKFTDTGYDDQGTHGWGDYITVSSKVVDEKMTVKGQTWPLNVTRSYSGYNTFRTAIQKSINTCSVKILAQIGIDYSMDTLKRFGISTAIDDPSKSVNDLNLAALGLGAMSYGISPLEMSLAYATFPNGGVRNTPICYTRVEDSSGRTLLEAKSETVRVLDEGVAWIMTDVLKSVVSDGIAKAADVYGIEVGGKTGTTDDRYDIWFNGFTPSYSVALWIGTDDNVQMDSASEKAAALWSTVVGNINRAYDGRYRSMPDNVFRAWNGEYYTIGTAPPEPPPEPVEDKDKKDKKSKSKKSGSGKSGSSGSSQSSGSGSSRKTGGN